MVFPIFPMLFFQHGLKNFEEEPWLNHSEAWSDSVAFGEGLPQCREPSRKFPRIWMAEPAHEEYANCGWNMLLETKALS